jgi:enoyl-CoA hydratase/carnithine racemase
VYRFGRNGYYADPGERRMVNASFTVADSVATVTIDRPDKLNAIDLPTKMEIIDRLETYRDDDDVRVVVFESTGDAFSAGGDLGEVVSKNYQLTPFTESWEELFDLLHSLGKPTVAKVDGYALGGGFDLVLHTDVVIASEDAVFGQPEIDLGLVNHFSPPLLHRTVGLRKTIEIMMLGEHIGAERAAEMGLITRTVPADDLDDEVESVVAELKSKPPRIMKKLKEALYDSLEMSPASGRKHIERVAVESVREDPDHPEGVDALLEGREPDWPER